MYKMNKDKYKRSWKSHCVVFNWRCSHEGEVQQLVQTCQYSARKLAVSQDYVNICILLISFCNLNFQMIMLCVILIVMHMRK